MPTREEQTEQTLVQALQRWADGKGTLKDVRGYSNDELYSVARMAYYFYYQGHLDEARTLFQGLYAVNPIDPYFANALGVVELACGNEHGALAAYDVTIKLTPDDPRGYVGRAEVLLVQGKKAQALDELRRAAAVGDPDSPLRGKVLAMISGLSKRGSDAR
jgi:type III secretion system low calcium response chaperone LcrH/SycD